MTPEESPVPDALHETPEVAPEDRELWEQLASHLADPEREGMLLSEEATGLLERLAQPVELDRALATRLNDLAARAEADLRYGEQTEARKRPASLGDYLAFLRTQAGLTVSEAARKYAIDFQLLSALERDTVPPQRIPARRLADMIRRLKGSLQLTEGLVLRTVRSPRYLATAGHNTLYRKGASRPGTTTSSMDPNVRLVENPEYTEEVRAAQRLQEELRSAWNSRR